MTNKETIERNIGLTFDFLKQVVKTPSMLDDIANGSVIEFVEKDFSKKETKKTVKPNRYLRVNTQFELVAEPQAHYGKKK
ncbi:MAG: hypothetical protein AABZ32_13115 [Bacteroidota bacterium]